MGRGNKKQGFVLVRREVLEEILRELEEIRRLVRDSCLKVEN